MYHKICPECGKDFKGINTFNPHWKLIKHMKKDHNIDLIKEDSLKHP